MISIPKQLIIIGSGASLKEGIEKNLWNKLKGKWTVGLNYSYRYFDSTILCYVDKDFYNEEKGKLRYLPLIVGKQYNERDVKFMSNTITLKVNPKYRRDVKLGCYKDSLAGIFGLSLGIYLLDVGEIYLLGYDFGHNKEKDKEGRMVTHFYQGEIKHRGVGKHNFYYGKLNNQPRANRNFGVYRDEKKVKIYNVCLTSRINVFPKISYDEFFEKLNKNNYDQNKIRDYIRRKLK